MMFKKIILTVALSTAGALFSTAQAQNHASSQEAANLKLVKTFYQQVFGNKDLSSIDHYLTKSYIQHNPQVADGRDAFKAAATQWLSGQPKEVVDVQHATAMGDIVMLHIKTKNQTGGVQAVVDIFRVSKGKIAEHWDVIQDAPATAANAHPMF